MLCEQFEHIHEIRQTYHGDSELSKANQMSMIKTLAEDLNKTNAHFIFELIQNAEDNTYETPLPYISFQLTKTDPTCTKGSDGALIIENNEIGFNRNDVATICAVGQSKKRKKFGDIGEKGIGFKSVFRVTDNPHIFSKGYEFCLPEFDEETGLGYIVPRWLDIPPEGLNPSMTYIVLPLTKSDFGYAKIESMLEDIQPEVILFLSTLKQIRIKTDTGIDFTIFKDNERQPEVTIDVKGNKVGNYNGGDFLVCPKTFDKPANITHKKREGVEDREVSIAFPLDENSTAIEKVFAYLPVQDDTGLPFLINADFILTSSRDDIHEDVPWNRWLMECVADLVVKEFLPLLKERERLNVDFLEALASKLNNLAEDKNNLFYPIFGKVRETLMNEEFLPANDRTYVSASNAKLARGNPIRNLLNHKQLSDLFYSINTTNETKWLSNEITQDLTPELRTYLTLKLDVNEVDPSMFARRLTLLFLSKQCDEWFIKFYRFLFGQPTLWRSQWSILRDKPILRLQDGAHVNPFKEDESPNAYLPIEQNTDISFPIVKIELTQDEKASGFLRELGIPKWDIVDEVISHIVPKYGHDSSTVPLANHKGDFAKIECACETNSRDKRNRLWQALQETPFILIESSDIGNVSYYKPNQIYFPNNELRLYFKGNGTCKFVNLDEYPPSAHGLFKKLGVEDSVRIERKEKDVGGRVIIYKRHGSHKRGLNGFDPDIKIDGLEYALNNPTPEKSAFIWNEIARSNVDCIRGTTETSSHRNYTYSDPPVEERSSGFGCLLIAKKWLPDSDGNMHKPSELTLKELPEGFVRDEQLAYQLRMKKDVVAELAEESGVPIKFIEAFRQNPEKCEEFLRELEAGKKTLEEKEQEIPEQSIQEKNGPYDRTPTDAGSTLLESSPNIDGENNSSTTKENKVPETGNVHTDSVSNESVYTSPQPSVSRPSSQDSSQGNTSRRDSGGHGGGGGGPGKTHEDLKDDLANNPSQLGEGLRLIKKEYTFKSGDGRVDVLLMDNSGKPVPVEVKPYISPESDSEILQALKYKHLAASDYDILCKEVRCILVAPEIPDDVKKKCKQLGIEPFIPATDK